MHEAAKSSGCPVGKHSAAASETKPSLFKFGRLLGEETIECLINLGTSMGNATTDDSGIPSGYTYLGQFIAHEITFDGTKDLPANGSWPTSARSPQIDLDSLYGASDEQSTRFYQEDGIHLKTGPTDGDPRSYDNDLPRDEKGVALIGDERNDENLMVAQVHVAFIKFHNKVVDVLADSIPQHKLLETARAEVVRHFQWIILNDHLKTLLDPLVLDDVLTKGPRLFKVESPQNLFMPIEFSAAAFRFGHSMVRNKYEWNFFHSSEVEGKKPVPLDQLFDQTHFSGEIGRVSFQTSRLQSQWVIDWRRFFDFKDFTQYPPPIPGINKARKIDTSINMGLEKIPGFPHEPLPLRERSIAVRNLLRGYALGLPSGEELARWCEAAPLTQPEISSGYEQCLNSRVLQGKTPLWYYILREAEVRGLGERLGPVGSRIVAETLIGLIKNSRYSILGNNWEPLEKCWRPGSEPGSVTFEMVDFLNFADVVNPFHF